MAAKSIHEFFWNFPLSLVDVVVWIGAKIWSIIPIDFCMVEAAVFYVIKLDIDWLYYASILELFMHGVVAISSTITILMILVIYIMYSFFTKREERPIFLSDQQVFTNQ